MADGESTAGGIGMGMIIALLIVLIVAVVGGVYFLGGKGANPVAAAGETVSDAGHTVSGTVNVK